MEAKSQIVESVEWFLDHLKVERAASVNTLEAYARDLAEVVELFPNLSDWAGLENSHLATFDRFLASVTSQRSAQRKASSFRSFLKFLVKNGVALQIDLPSTGGFKVGKRLPKALDTGAVQLMLTVESEGKFSPRNHAILELLYGAGLRVSELVSLETSQLDFDSGTIRIVGKRNKTRMVPLPADTLAALREYVTKHRLELYKKPTANVFISDRGGKMSRQAVYSVVAAAARASGVLGSVGPHTMRHTYAVHLLQGGADLRAVQELLGHESVATTQVYTELQTDEVKKRYRSAHPRR
jgi:integrase/recombinase XerD